MPRRGPITPREVAPDAVYGSVLLHQFVNKVMRRGKKSLAERLVYGALDILKTKQKEEVLKVFEKAVENCRAKVEVKSRRVGGATYQVPIEVLPRRQTSLALRWIVESAKQRPGHTMREKLAAELLDAYEGKGGAVKKREEVLRIAEANRAFAHYRW